MTPRAIETWRRQCERFETRVDELDYQALTHHAAAAGDPRVAGWLEGLAGPHWRRLGLFPVRGIVTPREGFGACWDHGDKVGPWLVVLPLLALGGTRRNRWNVVDLVALDPDAEIGAATGTGVFDGVLGEWLATSLLEREDGDRIAPRLRLFERPLDWLRHVADPAHDDDEDVAACIAWPDGPAAREALLYSPALVAANRGHAAALDRRIKTLRRQMTPPTPELHVLAEEVGA
jgi:hypothetical protein